MTDREAFAYFLGNIAAVHRARSAVVDGTADNPGTVNPGAVAAVAVPDFLRAGWGGAASVVLRTLQRAFGRQLTPAGRAAWTSGEEGRRRSSVYLTRPPSTRNHTWESDHKQLPSWCSRRAARRYGPG
ncbi:hypothetical protein [Nonomuraea sp. bgisy101]|uniref:hypothetical protein n=1 Tax=Nonomuraea sp. bgisy101 TaxID=3413784 RepID=UPI003D70D9F1